MCEVDIEHILHLNFDCSFAKGCWRSVGIEFDAMRVDDCSEWLLQKLASESNDTMVQMVTILSGIWSAKN